MHGIFLGAPHSPSKTGVNALVFGRLGGHKGSPYDQVK
jgi:hypothetical protein